MPRPRLEIELTIEEFDVMEHRLGYKHEYWDGKARLSPNHCAIADFQLSVSDFLRCHLNTRPFDADTLSKLGQCEIIPPNSKHRDALIELFEIAFANDAQFDGYPESAYREAAVKAIDRALPNGIQTGHDLANEDLAYSKVMICDGQPIGALLVTVDRDHRKTIGPLMVTPQWQRKGVARRLLLESCRTLAMNSIDQLHSHCHMANSDSLTWHRSMGFQERLHWLATAHRMRHHQQNAQYHRHHGRDDLALCHEELQNAFAQLHDLLHDDEYSRAQTLTP